MREQLPELFPKLQHPLSIHVEDYTSVILFMDLQLDIKVSGQ